MKLFDQARVGIVGGGPSGSMTGYFLLEMAERIGMQLQVDIYESRDFTKYGPPGCNMCAGVVSESLIQTLAAEGIHLPSLVVQRGIDSYVLHTSGLDPVTIDTPSEELRIATVYRGGGPKKPSGEDQWSSFDLFLLEMARKKGANIIRKRVTDLSLQEGKPTIVCWKKEGESYDLVVGAVGVNSPTLKHFSKLGLDFKPPPVTKGFLAEIQLGVETVQHFMGSSMHIFLLDIPRLKFAALIPKVEYVTVCLMGQDIDKTLVERFMNSPEVRSCFPEDLKWNYSDKGCDSGQTCRCGPKLNMGPALTPYADRVVLVGDSAVTRLYKDGIGAAYITAKACAVTALFFGVSAMDFKKQYHPVSRRIATDNFIGRIIFWVTLFYQKWTFLRRGMVTMVTDERSLPGQQRIMSRVLWDTFTGSATYRDIFFRSMHPLFFFRLIASTMKAWIASFSK